MARLIFVVFASYLTVAGAGFVLAQEKAGDKQESGDTTDESSRDEVSRKKGTLADRIKSVQRKMFLKRNRHELGINVGASLNDAFYEDFTVGGSYAYHILDTLALEANVKYYLAVVRTDAVRVVRASQSAAPPFDISFPVFNADLDLQFSPIYGKMSLMSEKIVHYDIYFAVGGGAAQTDPTGWHPMGSAAIGARVFTTDWLTIRFEIRDQIYNDTRTVQLNKESAIQNFILFNLGVSFFLPPSFDYRYE